jgi:hypothetical protein
MGLLRATTRQCFFFSEHCLLQAKNKISRTKRNGKGIRRIKWIFYFFKRIKKEEVYEEN